MNRKPFRESFHYKKRNEVLYYGFISMYQLAAKSNQMYKYVLILKDDISGFVELAPSTSPDHFALADSLMECYKGFGVPKTLISDQGSHFVDKTLKELNSMQQKKHIQLQQWIRLLQITSSYTSSLVETVEINLVLRTVFLRTEAS